MKTIKQAGAKGITTGDLAKRMKMHPSQASTMTKRLRERGEIKKKGRSHIAA